MVLAAACAATIHLQDAAAAVATGPTISADIYLPDGETIRRLAPGLETTLSDVYWLQLVQHLGTPEAQRAGWPHLHPLAELITDIDPAYGYVYQAAGVALAEVGRLEASNALLEKGTANVPDRWQLPFYLAFNHWYSAGDHEAGALWLERASRVAEAPAYVRTLVTRLYSTAGRLDLAGEFVLAMRLDPDMAEQADAVALELRVEHDLRLLESAVDQYRIAHGHPPATLEALVPGVLSVLPVSPTGAPYTYAPLAGEVSYPPLTRRHRLPSAIDPTVRTQRADSK